MCIGQRHSRLSCRSLLWSVPYRDWRIDGIPFVLLLDQSKKLCDQRSAGGSVSHDNSAISFGAVTDHSTPKSKSAAVVRKIPTLALLCETETDAVLPNADRRNHLARHGG